MRSSTTQPIRSALGYVTAPIHWLVRQPFELIRGIDSYFASRAELREENARLSSEALVLKGKVQKLVSLTAENVRLRELLGSSTILEDSVLVAEIISVSPDPNNHQIVIDKHAGDGVYVNQPVIDAYGLIGQVVEVGALSSRVILISDSRHALPVQVSRNGVRAILEGTGQLDRLALSHVVETTDIKEGDLLVSSGLGQRFPVGYPVGVVDSVSKDGGDDFVTVTVRPSAQLDRTRHVLLVFTGGLPGSKSAASP